MLTCCTPGIAASRSDKRSIKLFRARLIHPAEARIHFEEEIVIDAQSGIERRRFVRAADEQGRRGEKRERESDLHHDQRIARQKTPAAPNRVFAGMFLQIADHAVAR